jgi:hypothetical protein
VSIYACTGDWTGNWDCSLKPEVDRFISPDLSKGRVVEVIERGEPAAMFCHWTGIYYNGQELGFRVMQEIVRRINARYRQVVWMELADLARYWAAKELTTIQAPAMVIGGKLTPLREVRSWHELAPGTWRRDGDRILVCIRLAKGVTEIQSKA